MKRYAIVGAGHRCFMMFARNIDARKELNAELCGVYDIIAAEANTSSVN